MIDTQTAAVLQEIWRRERRTYLQYLGEVLPWPNLEPEEIDRLRRLIADDSHTLAGLAQFLTRQRIPLPFRQPYPGHFMNVNFVTYEHALRLLLDDQRQALAHLVADQVRVTEAEAQAPVQALLDAKRRIVAQLETLAKSQHQPAAP